MEHSWEVKRRDFGSRNPFPRVNIHRFGCFVLDLFFGRESKLTVCVVHRVGAAHSPNKLLVRKPNMERA